MTVEGGVVGAEEHLVAMVVRAGAVNLPVVIVCKEGGVEEEGTGVAAGGPRSDEAHELCIYTCDVHQNTVRPDP